jgi:hypothetical protein
MRSKKKFSDKPKRTHEERRISHANSYCWDGWDAMSGAQKNERTMIAANALAKDDARRFCRIHKLPPWMKRSHYLKAFNQECRRGKWAKRSKRRKESF